MPLNHLNNNSNEYIPFTKIQDKIPNELYITIITKAIQYSILNDYDHLSEYEEKGIISEINVEILKDYKEEIILQANSNNTNIFKNLPAHTFQLPPTDKKPTYTVDEFVDKICIPSIQWAYRELHLNSPLIDAQIFPQDSTSLPIVEADVIVENTMQEGYIYIDTASRVGAIKSKGIIYKLLPFKMELFKTPSYTYTYYNLVICADTDAIMYTSHDQYDYEILHHILSSISLPYQNSGIQSALFYKNWKATPINSTIQGF